METLISFKRSGANAIIAYFADKIAKRIIIIYLINFQILFFEFGIFILFGEKMFFPYNYTYNCKTF